MSLFKKRTQKRAAKAIDSSGETKLESKSESRVERRTQLRAEPRAELVSESDALAKLSAKVTAKWSADSSTIAATGPADSFSLNQYARVADEPPATFSPALAARLSGESLLDPKVEYATANSPATKTLSTANSEGQSWDIWYATFRAVATLGNSRLQLQGADENIIDLMDHQPLIEAFNSAVDPAKLGEQFAADFDVGVFLRDNGVFK